MKEFATLFMSAFLCFAYIGNLPVYSETYAETDLDFPIQIDYLSPYIEKWKFADELGEHEILVDRQANSFEVDGKKLTVHSEKSLTIPTDPAFSMYTAVTLDETSGITYTVDVPFSTGTALAAEICAIVPGTGWTIASEIAKTFSALSTDAVVVFTQFKSKEYFYSSYANVYYKKCINLGIKWYNGYIASENLYSVCPYDGTWFDPVRPY